MKPFFESWHYLRSSTSQLELRWLHHSRNDSNDFTIDFLNTLLTLNILNKTALEKTAARLPSKTFMNIKLQSMRAIYLFESKTMQVGEVCKCDCDQSTLSRQTGRVVSFPWPAGQSRGRQDRTHHHRQSDLSCHAQRSSALTHHAGQ